ncbi:MAG: hypothetical protein J6Q54_08935 [Oscillospiraceae bacterium]|nr:hypothetical protein [Oscillospiraceae bacterium]
MKKWFKNLKSKWQQWSDGVPRKTKVVCYVLAILLFVFLIYVFKGAPALSWQHRYRRIERSYMIGPGEIMGYEQVSGYLYKDAVLARTDDAVIITTITPELYEHEQLLYLPTEGKRIIVSAAPQLLPELDTDLVEDTVTMFVVDEYPEAVRVELDMELYWLNGEEEYVRPVFSLSGEREKDGYFRMDIPYESWGEYAPEYLALKYFLEVTRNRILYDIPEKEFSATVRLYDAEGNLIIEEQQYIFE